ncbi:DNA-dependent protein kinase catalytic subunit-interacting protein 2 [Capsaspora owczarzaki ATCC 30864]|uniref:DNA-dependent protein kinase catalytic subunit-interacting protein 2 n=1 Tax=Capsaspora owczarzaki (strain ATCC 30864) TaxID=595528 RepID=A0A0D2WL55_CAPO3|nr:DNA-dependent protein kinase catalytic subunit-interacting protein 2 [Capsaspora owczarzaki ATCC 30864]
MGQTQSYFTEEQLLEYEDCTYFTRHEIIKIYEHFMTLCKTEPGQLTKQEVKTLPEVAVNPFKDRIIDIFSDDGTMSFEDYLDMLSVFSDQATKDVKASIAFRIYDMDGDGFLGYQDLYDTIERMCFRAKEKGEQLQTQEIASIARQILAETDMDSDDKLSYVEFEHIISRAPDFAK